MLFIPPIDHKSVLIQVMAWCQTDAKTLPEAMMTTFIDAFMSHQDSMSWFYWRFTYLSKSLQKVHN